MKIYAYKLRFIRLNVQYGPTIFQIDLLNKNINRQILYAGGEVKFRTRWNISAVQMAVNKIAVLNSSFCDLVLLYDTS